MSDCMNRPEVAELVELVQTRLGTTREAAEDHIRKTILGEPQTGATTGADLVQEALARYRAMPRLAVTPAPPNFYLVRFHQIMADLEWITASVENGQTMPTPDEIRSLFRHAGRMKAVAVAAGFEFEGDK
jgi:hypothetical protein